MAFEHGVFVRHEVVVGRVLTDFETTEFLREHPIKFQRAAVVEGRFADETTNAFFETRSDGSIEIQYREGMNRIDIVTHLWRLVGVTYEADWRLYSMALSKCSANAREFLTERKSITDKDREDVEFGIGFTSKEQIEQLKSALLVIYLSKGQGSQKDFEALWEKCHGGSEVIRVFAVFCDRSLLSAALTLHGDQACLKIVRAAGVDVTDWQRCRQLLGLFPYSFAESVAKWNEVRGHMVALLKAALARFECGP